MEKILLGRTFVEEKLASDHPNEKIRAELDILTERAYMMYRPRVLSRLIDMKLKMGDDPVYLSWRLAERGGFTNLFVVSHDEPGLFAKIAGVLSANNVNILGAQILTRKDGVVFDVLHVTDSVMKPIKDKVKNRIVNRELKKAVAGELDVDELFKNRNLSLPLDRRDRALAIPPKVEIQNDISDEHTVIDIYATDRIGLLYQITSTLAALGLSIYTAKVSTKVDQAVDVFYVKDLDGLKVTEPEKLVRIKETLLGVLTQEET